MIMTPKDNFICIAYYYNMIRDNGDTVTVMSFGSQVDL